jgi:hypothetical protein
MLVGALITTMVFALSRGARRWAQKVDDNIGDEAARDDLKARLEALEAKVSG